MEIWRDRPVRFSIGIPIYNLFKAFQQIQEYLLVPTVFFEVLLLLIFIS